MCKCPGVKEANEGTGADVCEGHRCQDPGVLDAGLEYTRAAGKEDAAIAPTLNNEAPDGLCAI